MESAVFHQVGDLDLTMDVMRPAAKTARYVVWIHGGALMLGNRHSVPGWLSMTCLSNGFGLASIDYRLAPTTKLPEIVGDVERAISWLFLANDGQVPSALAIVGESAGGYLAMTAGFRAMPAPDAVVSLWGYGDLLDDWYTKPSPYPVHHEIEMPEDEARSQVAGPEVADDRDRPGNAYAFYQFCRQQGLWPIEVSGWDPVSDSQRFGPYMPIENVTSSYPPTLLAHGTDDTDVPHRESLKMAALFDRHGVPHELVSVEGAEHGLHGATPAEIEQVHERASRFLVEHLGPGTR